MEGGRERESFSEKALMSQSIFCFRSVGCSLQLEIDVSVLCIHFG